MAQFGLKLRDISRYQIQYPVAKSNDNIHVISDSPIEASHQLITIAGTDQVSFTFDRPFSGIPTVIAGFVSLNNNDGCPNVYVESVTNEGGVIRTSSTVEMASITVHAIYVAAS